MTVDAQQAADVGRLLADAVSEAFIAETAARQAHRDPTRLTLSGWQGCTRAAAYAVAGVAPSDPRRPDEARQANLGTAAHEWLLPRIADALGGGLVEHPVTLQALGVEVPGTLDLYARGIVVDVKTVGEHRLQGVRRRGAPYDNHRGQIRGYGLAAYQAGHDVQWLVFLYMDRSTGEVEVLVEQFTTAVALRVLDRAREIIDWAEHSPDEAPREERGPRLSITCDHCPWLRRCWGAEATPGVLGGQASAVRSDADVEAVCAEYLDAAQREREAKADKAFALAKLSGTGAGTYGLYRVRRLPGQFRLAQDLVEEGYREGVPAGSVLPRRRTAPTVKITMLGARE